jgi:hypothetical protein
MIGAITTEDENTRTGFSGKYGRAFDGCGVAA